MQPNSVNDSDFISCSGISAIDLRTYIRAAIWGVTLWLWFYMLFNVVYHSHKILGDYTASAQCCCSKMVCQWADLKYFILYWNRDCWSLGSIWFNYSFLFCLLLKHHSTFSSIHCLLLFCTLVISYVIVLLEIKVIFFVWRMSGDIYITSQGWRGMR